MLLLMWMEKPRALAANPEVEETIAIASIAWEFTICQSSASLTALFAILNPTALCSRWLLLSPFHR